MSRAAILIALARVLHRQPTPEDMATFCGELLQRCPEGRVYIAPKTLTDSEVVEQIVNLQRDGMGVKSIAKALGIHRRRVRRLLRGGPLSACNGPSR